jgi:hypothetical protein
MLTETVPSAASRHLYRGRPTRQPGYDTAAHDREPIRVHLRVESGLHETAYSPANGYLMHSDRYTPKRHLLRKPQCQFVWDWSIRFINVEFDGVVTILMSYLLATKQPPAIGMKVRPIFRTKEPTYTITDLAFVPAETKGAELPEGFTFSK